MKILSSSPYATFVAKEWNLSINSPNLINPTTTARIEKKFNKSVINFEIQKQSKVDLKRAQVIQLSFA